MGQSESTFKLGKVEYPILSAINMMLLVLVDQAGKHAKIILSTVR